MKEWQKIVKYGATAFAIFLSVSIIGSLVGLAGIFLGAGDISGEMQTYSCTGEYTELEIDIAAAELKIIKSDAFKVESNHKYLKITERGNKLEISETRRFWNTTPVDAVIEIYVPESAVFKKAAIVAGAGKVTIDSLSAEEIDLELGAGEVEIGYIYAGKDSEIDGGAGKLTIKDGSLADLELNMGVGELNLTAELLGNAELDYGIGGTELTLLGEADDYRVELDKGIGDATINGEIMNDGKTYGNGRNRVEINGGIGAIKVNFKSK